MFLKLYGFVDGLERSVIKLSLRLLSEYRSFLLQYYFIELVRVTVYSFTLTVLQIQLRVNYIGELNIKNLFLIFKQRFASPAKYYERISTSSNSQSSDQFALRILCQKFQLRGQIRELRVIPKTHIHSSKTSNKL